jgi:ankyrin repeat protein
MHGAIVLVAVLLSLPGCVQPSMSQDSPATADTDPNRPDARGETAVHRAAFSGDAARLSAVLAAGGDPDVRNPQTGATPLVSALLSPNAGQYRVLLEAGADPGIADRNGDTPLHVAARTNAGGAILDLLEAGASPTATNARGDSFQPYYFGYRRSLLDADARATRARVAAWLRARGIPLEAAADGD